MHSNAVRVFVTFIFCSSAFFSRPCWAADVLVVADTQLKPVTEIISGIRKALKASIKVYPLHDVRSTLSQVAERENAKVVVALGKSALAEALRLPTSIAVIYDLVVVPPAVNRPNTTGFYMATPAREYADLINNYLHCIRRIAVVGSRSQLNLLARGESAQQTNIGVKNSLEFINTVRQMESTDAILLLPDTTVLTTAAMDQAYLLSFQKGIPLIGVSEQNVKEGALLALVVDMVNVGKLIGESAVKAMRGMNLGQIPPSPPKKFDMYLNLATASKMGIPIPHEMMRLAKKVYN